MFSGCFVIYFICEVKIEVGLKWNIIMYWLYRYILYIIVGKMLLCWFLLDELDFYYYVIFVYIYLLFLLGNLNKF